jgi:hypothetical protein
MQTSFFLTCFRPFAWLASALARISHTPSSRDAARTRHREARPEFPAGLYENILSKGNPGRNEAGARRSKSQQKGYEKCGLVLAPTATRCAENKDVVRPNNILIVADDPRRGAARGGLRHRAGGQVAPRGHGEVSSPAARIR